MDNNLNDTPMHMQRESSQAGQSTGAKIVTEADIERAEALAQAARARANRLSEIRRRQVVVPEMRKRIGDCFKYRNCYSCPQKPSDYWFIYARIVNVRNGRFIAFSIQKDVRGRITIERDAYSFAPISGVEPMDGWTKIGRREFDRSVARIMTQAKMIVKGRAV